MARAVWHGAVLAESEDVKVVEGNVHFPPESINREYLVESPTRTRCPWKGVATYYDVVVNGEVNRDAAWTYPDPTEAAMYFKDYVAFWRGVVVEP
jgi:uncharacterized protein (DUF427 family)